MMQKRLLSLLLITVAVLGIGLILTQRQQPTVEGRSESGPLVPGLAAALNDVSSIRISKAKGELVAELTRGDAGWIVANRSNYLADVGKVREYLIKLSESKVREAKTSKPENYARLGVEDVTSETATGVAVELGGLKDPVKLIVGVSSGGGTPGTFVRRDGEAVSYLVSGDVIPDKEGQNWLAREVIDIASAQVRTVTVTAPDKSVLKLSKTDPTAFNYSVENVPKGRALSSESVGNQTAALLAGLTLEDVLPADQATPDAATTWSASFNTYDGYVVDATLWDNAGKSWMKFATRIDEAQLDAWVAAEKTKADAARTAAEAAAAAKAETAEAKPETGADAASAAQPVADAAAPDSAIPAPFDADKTKADKRAELEKRMTDFNAKSAPWVYAIPTWKAANLKKKVDDLLAPKA